MQGGRFHNRTTALAIALLRSMATITKFNGENTRLWRFVASAQRVCILPSSYGKCHILMWTYNTLRRKLLPQTALRISCPSSFSFVRKDQWSTNLLLTPDTSPPMRKSRRQDGDRLSKTARHKHIIAQLSAAPTLRASEIAAVLGVSGETIRPDLWNCSTRSSSTVPMAVPRARSRWSLRWSIASG